MIVEDPHMAGPTTADFLAARGHAVTILTPSYTVGEALDDTLKPIILERLLAQGVRLVPLHRAIEIHPDRIVAVHTLTGEHATFEAESIVVASGGRANDSLFDALRGRIAALFVVGDAVAPRRVHDAVLEGTRVGRQV